MIVAKFGGTSLATRESVMQVVEIIKSDTRRQVCVVSAPGRCVNFPKLTDLLLRHDIQSAVAKVSSLVESLPVSADVAKRVVRMVSNCSQYMPVQYRVARGESISALLLSDLLGWRCLPAQDVIQFASGQVRVLPRFYAEEPVVIPGFYGWCVDSQSIKTFPRGGSDISAAYIAAAWKAVSYENWTDVNGVHNNDPREVVDAIPYAHISYQKLRKIADAGAAVVHPDAVVPVELSQIPLHVKNTFQPSHPGTVVS